jgi:hypothetical protein
VLPAAVGTRPAAWLEGNYVTLVLTGQFLLTVHATPSAPLQCARHEYRGLEDQDARADEVRLLFLVSDVLIGSFRPQLLALDDRLGEIQLGMPRGVSPQVHDELVKILGVRGTVSDHLDPAARPRRHIPARPPRRGRRR